MIQPHGGKLISRTITVDQLPTDVPALSLNEREKNDLEMISCGAMSPLEGFMNGKDYNSVVKSMRLGNGIAWTLPVVFSMKEEEVESE